MKIILVGIDFALKADEVNMFFKNAIIKQTPIPIVAQGLDAYMMRSKAINNNLSNITTPGYQRIEVSFEEQLQRALDLSLIHI